MTLTENDRLSVWNADGTRRASLDGVRVETLSPEGAMLATSGLEPGVRLWRLSDMTPVATLETQEDVSRLAFDTVRPNVLTAVGGGGTIWAFDVLNPELEVRPVRTGLNVDSTDVNVVRVPAEAPTLLMTSGSGAVGLWDIHVGVALEKFDLSGRISDLRLDDDGSYSFLQTSWVPRGNEAHSVATVRLWRGRTARPVRGLHTKADTAEEVVQTSFSRDHEHLNIVYETDDGWEVESRPYPELESAPRMRPRPPEGAAFANATLFLASDANAERLVTVTVRYGSPNTTRIEMWDPATGGMLRELSSDHPNGSVEAVDMSPDGESVLISGYDDSMGEGYVEEIFTNGIDSPVGQVSYGGTLSAIAWDPDGRFFLVGDARGRTYIGTTSGGSLKLLGTEKEGRAAPTTYIAISSDSRLIATGAEDGRVDLYERASRRHLRRFELGNTIFALEFGRGNRYLLADGENTPTTVFSTTGDEDRNAVMLVDPIPEPSYQSAAFDLSNGELSVVSTDGRHVLRYPCVACVSEEALLTKVRDRLEREKLG